VVGTIGAVALGLGFLFLSLYGGILESVETLLFGSFVGITRGQVETLLIVALLAGLVLAAVGRPLFYASVDERAARADGVPVRALSVVFLVLLGLAVAAIAQIVGVLLTFALLVAPAATAQLLTVRLRLSLALAVAIAVAETWAALTLSYFTNVALGFAVTTIALVLYGCARRAAGCGTDVRAAVRSQRTARRLADCGRERPARLFHRPARPGVAGDALSHVAFTGALAAAAAGVDLRAGLFGATVLMALLFATLGERARADDVTIGVVFAWILGLGVLFLDLFNASSSGGSGIVGARHCSVRSSA